MAAPLPEAVLDDFIKPALDVDVGLVSTDMSGMNEDMGDETGLKLI